MAFFQATSDSLPSVTFDMVWHFLSSNSLFTSPEYRGVKAARSSRAEYGDEAIGFVELRRDSCNCYVNAKITPEHKVRVKPYSVSAVVDEASHLITDAVCHDCAASEGGCKHAVAFLFWLHRRSEEPAPTATVSYWRRSALAAVGTRRFISAQEFCGEKYVHVPNKDSDFSVAVYNLCSAKKVNNMLTLVQKWDNPLYQASLHHVMLNMKADGTFKKPIQINEYCLTVSKGLSQEMLYNIEQATLGQRESSLWFELRYGRVTASSIYECSRCHTKGGSLVDKILGASRPIKTGPVQRGIRLEGPVLNAVEAKLGLNIKKCGLFLSQEFSFLGGSPDGIGTDFVVEIKCPSTNIERYLVDGKVAPGYNAQLQINMFLTGMKKCLFVVASPNFERSGDLNLVWVNYSDGEARAFIELAYKFWANEIFPRLG